VAYERVIDGKEYNFYCKCHADPFEKTGDRVENF